MENRFSWERSQIATRAEPRGVGVKSEKGRKWLVSAVERGQIQQIAYNAIRQVCLSLHDEQGILDIHCVVWLRSCVIARLCIVKSFWEIRFMSFSSRDWIAIAARANRSGRVQGKGQVVTCEPSFCGPMQPFFSFIHPLKKTVIIIKIAAEQASRHAAYAGSWFLAATAEWRLCSGVGPNTTTGLCSTELCTDCRMTSSLCLRKRRG